MNEQPSQLPEAVGFSGHQGGRKGRGGEGRGFLEPTCVPILLCPMAWGLCW